MLNSNLRQTENVPDTTPNDVNYPDSENTWEQWVWNVTNSLPFTNPALWNANLPLFPTGSGILERKVTVYEISLEREKVWHLFNTEAGI